MDINQYNNSIITIANLHNRMIQKQKNFIPNSIIFCSILCLLILPIESQNYTDLDYVDTEKIKLFEKLQKQKLYAGYLNLANENQAFYYMYFQSHLQPDKDPIILWLGGGTNCSSLVGMMYNGPFAFQATTNQTYTNENTWNANANLLYIQSPLGVGFSKGNANFMNDTAIAQNNYQALLKFFQKYPKKKANDFYIAGQNYAGIHIVRLATQIVANNQQEAAQERKIFIKGILIGNGCTHPTQCTTAEFMSRYQVQFLYTRGFLDDSIYSLYQSQCIKTNRETQKNCTLIQKAIQQKFMSSKANIYNIYGTCYSTSNSYKDQQLMPQQQINVHNPKVPLQCADMVGLNYLFNKNQTRQILHLQPLEKLKWIPCGGFNYTKQSRAAYNFLPNLIKYGIQVHYYSGYFDAMVPIQGTISWLKKFRNDFGVSIKRNWRPWSIDKKVFSGMVWQLDGITFWSVSGAGSMVPKDKPQSAKLILDVLLGKKSIDDVELSMGKQLNQF